MLPTLDPVRLSGRRLGSGVHRSGYLLKLGDESFCIKVADYRPANSREAAAWAELKASGDDRLFCEVLAAADNGAWLIMPLCQPLAYDAAKILFFVFLVLALLSFVSGAMRRPPPV